MNLRFKWVGRWSPSERQFRFFRVMWETVSDNAAIDCSNKVSVSIKNWLPRITWRKSFGGTYV